MELTPAPLSREAKRTKPFSKRNQAHKALFKEKSSAQSILSPLSLGEGPGVRL